MNELEQARGVIDEVDKQMAELFCRRMDAVRSVAQYKHAHGLAVFDAAREEQVIQHGLSQLAPQQQSYAQYYEAFLRCEMALSRAMQKKLLAADTVAYQGMPGAFSQLALQRLFPHAAQLACDSWAQVFEAVRSSQAGSGVLPFENSYAGDVSEVLDLCFACSDIFITQMYDLPVEQNLLALPGVPLSEMEVVVSHQQALMQCADFLKGLGVQTQLAENTAQAAAVVAKSGCRRLAAIASQETAALYGLEVIAAHIHQGRQNTTRFIVIEQQPANAGTHFSLLFTVNHRAGALAQVMQVIARYGLNMESIKSRPTKHSGWEYYFYAELVGDVRTAQAKAMLAELETVCCTVRVLGVYCRMETEEWI